MPTRYREIEVSGMLRTLATGSRHSGSISLLTRGTVTITGELTTGETDGAASGESLLRPLRPIGRRPQRR